MPAVRYTLPRRWCGYRTQVIGTHRLSTGRAGFTRDGGRTGKKRRRKGRGDPAAAGRKGLERAQKPVGRRCAVALRCTARARPAAAATWLPTWSRTEALSRTGYSRARRLRGCRPTKNFTKPSMKRVMGLRVPPFSLPGPTDILRIFFFYQAIHNRGFTS